MLKYAQRHPKGPTVKKRILTKLGHALALSLSFFILTPSVLAAPNPIRLFEPLNDAKASYIAVYAFPSAEFLDWSSPSALTKTTLDSQISKALFHAPSSIGHAQFAWQCQLPNGKVIKGASGQSGQNHRQGLSGVLSGWGLSLLELVYTDGNIESTQEVNDRVIRGSNTNKLSWMAFKVPPENCLKVVEYVKTYTAKGAFHNYGFPVDPLQYEGGGCTSYANAALAVSKLEIPFRKQWVRSYDVPNAYMGHTDELPVFSTIVPKSQTPAKKQKVALMDFLTQDIPWASAGQPSYRFNYYDPELFYESFLHIENAFRKSQGMGLRVPTRTKTLDHYQTELKQATDSWMTAMLAGKHAMSLETLYGVSGLVVDLRPPQ